MDPWVHRDLVEHTELGRGLREPERVGQARDHRPDRVVAALHRGDAVRGACGVARTNGRQQEACRASTVAEPFVEGEERSGGGAVRDREVDPAVAAHVDPGGAQGALEAEVGVLGADPHQGCGEEGQADHTEHEELHHPEQARRDHEPARGAAQRPAASGELEPTGPRAHRVRTARPAQTSGETGTDRSRFARTSSAVAPRRRASALSSSRCART